MGTRSPSSCRRAPSASSSCASGRSCSAVWIERHPQGLDAPGTAISPVDLPLENGDSTTHDRQEMPGHGAHAYLSETTTQDLVRPGLSRDARVQCVRWCFLCQFTIGYRK